MLELRRAGRHQEADHLLGAAEAKAVDQVGDPHGASARAGRLAA